jgi:hypothetical protein
MSERMPTERRRMRGERVFAIALGVGAALVGKLLSWPEGVVVGLTSAVLVAFAVIAGRSRARRIAAERSGESICGFARSFERRAVDTRVIREVYEGFTSFCRHPIRATDDLFDDIGFDEVEVEEFGAILADRAGRTPEGWDQDPLYGRVSTVGDLVRFLDHQPLVRGHEAPCGARPVPSPVTVRPVTPEPRRSK